MHSLTAWFIRNPVGANLLMGFILLLGVLTLVSIRIEGFPRVPPESVEITTIFEGATAQQVDELVTQKIEQALEGLPGVRSITSESSNESSTVSVRRRGGQDLQRLLDKVRLKIDGIIDFPEAAKRPVIETNGFDIPALYVNVVGETDPATLQTLARRLKEDLLSKPELSRLKIWGIVPQEMRIEVDPERLRQLNLTISDLSDAIRKNSIDFQSGKLNTAGGSISLRADNRARFAADFAAVPVVERPDGSVVKLGDITSVRDTFAEGDYLFRLNGKPTVGMVVLVGQKENLLEISRVVNAAVADYEYLLPPGISVTVWGDSAGFISDRLQLLRSNGVQGLLLVILMLSLFLNVRLAFWVAMGIPVSVLGAVAVAGSRWVDYSLNDVTTFGLIIALGILVDDAVVVGESVFEERQNNKDSIRGTEEGVNKVAIATVFGVLTTIAALFPMFVLDNPLGKVLAGFSGIVIFALLFSLLESKFILPAHLAHLSIGQPPRSLPGRLWGRVQQGATGGLMWFRDRVYLPILVWSIHHRYTVLVLFLAAGSMGIGQIGLGKIKTVFFPDVPGQVITVTLEMDARAPFRLTRKNILNIQKIGEDLNLELQQNAGLDKPPIRTVFVQVDGGEGGQIYAELTPVKDRSGIEILDVIRQWRARTGQVEGSSQLQFTGSESFAGGFVVELMSKDTELLRLASKEVRDFLAQIEGVSNVRDSLKGGQPELRLRLRPEARNLGFTAESLASQIGLSFGGSEIQKIRRGSSEAKVIVLNSRQARDTIADLLRTRLRSSTGAWVPLPTVAKIEGGYVSGSVLRLDGNQANSVAASIDRSIVAPEEVGQAVQEELMPILWEQYPSVFVELGGEIEEIGEIKGGLLRALILAAVAIYVLMAVPLKSYWQPFIILAIIPFGFVGAAIGHLIMDVPLSILSFFGMLALAGVVVNDSLVMMTRYNDALKAGMPIDQALKKAGVGRFRAIFLTTATTVIGLAPLLMETSEQAQYLIPAAISLAYGEVFATLLMLILVPVLIAIVGDIRFGARHVLFVEGHAK
ncbi:efflux RND transporter permease subunit [Pelagibius sp. Alg239-R121]|uniref:efflux RND transporter permease subunit n=1 Tax=Pelagibius sp. Alg239-R121 TaxID=2993448 RepID=UPI0024A6DD19|nr:efflux RND transporter permease subunit [Pelagibius sp. Alg239-R121]